MRFIHHIRRFGEQALGALGLGEGDHVANRLRTRHQRDQAVETEGGVAFVSVLSVTLSCDHRVVDGALGAELVAAFKRFVEQPATMLV